MGYYFSKILDLQFEEAIGRVTEELKKEGFGIMSNIDVGAAIREKLNVDFRPYWILGACNPHFAYQALRTEDKIGTMLPCNVVVQQIKEGKVEVAAIDPVASMQAVDNRGLRDVAEQVRAKLIKVVENV